MAASLAERESYRERALRKPSRALTSPGPDDAHGRPPIGIGDLALRERMISLTRPFNALGWPALALPCGPDRRTGSRLLSDRRSPWRPRAVLAVGEVSRRGCLAVSSTVSRALRRGGRERLVTSEDAPQDLVLVLATAIRATSGCASM